MQINVMRASRPVPPIDVQAARHGDDAGFVQLLDAYRPSGGIARADYVVGRLCDRRRDGVGTIARWIAEGQVVHFQWNDDWWLPLFQFVQPAFLPHAGLQRVLAQLAPALDPWDIALWFARPSPWLGELPPAALLATRAVQVEQAARADRFALEG